jgi:hypothetical protein
MLSGIAVALSILELVSLMGLSGETYALSVVVPDARPYLVLVDSGLCRNLGTRKTVALHHGKVKCAVVFSHDFIL